ncbi:MAG: STAS domain-containing protein [Rubrobacteraceae bacterium]
MDFEVNIVEHAESYSLVSVRGEIDLHSAPKVQNAVERGANGVEAVIVDLREITFMDSTALSMFMRAKDELGGRGISLRLANPSEAVERIFGVTGFGEYFEVFPSREAAIAD